MPKDIKIRIVHFFTATLLSIALLLPYALKLHHAFEHHKDTVECAVGGTHLHPAEPHSHYLDYGLIGGILSSNLFGETLSKKNIPQKNSDYYTSLIRNRFFTNTSSRGPPSV